MFGNAFFGQTHFGDPYFGPAEGGNTGSGVGRLERSQEGYLTRIRRIKKDDDEIALFLNELLSKGLL